MPSSSDVPLLFKQPAESTLFFMDFSANMGQAETIQSIAAPVVSPASGLVIGTPTILGQVAQMRISGGTAGICYKITVQITTSLSNILECEGKLQIYDH